MGQEEQSFGKKHFLHALSDQGAVSAGNFLAIALGAHFLPLEEQGKLIYAFSVYYGLVIFNVAAFFNSALLVRGERAGWACYQRLLLKWQLGFALSAAFLLALILALAGTALDWRLSWTESISLGAFYVIQQLADFYRRSGYIFAHIAGSALSSQMIFWIRLLAILLAQPATLVGFLWVFVLSAAFGMFALLIQAWRARRVACDKRHNQLLSQSHVFLSKWNVVNAPLAWSGLHLPILLIGAVSGKEAAAIVGSIRGITSFLNVLLELLETYIPTWLASKITPDGHLSRSPSIRLLAMGLAIWLAGFVLLLLAGEQIVLFLLGECYLSYAYILYIIWVANGLYFAGRVIGLHFRMTRDTRAQAIGSMGGILALLVALPLIQRDGIGGGAWSFAIIQAGVILTLVLYWVAKSRR